MTSSAVADLARAIAAGELDACPILADALEEAGRPDLGRRLRVRFRRWQLRRARLVDGTDRWLRAIRTKLDELQRTVKNAGGSMTFAVESFQRGLKEGALLLHEDHLLRQYVQRLVAEMEDASHGAVDG